MAMHLIICATCSTRVEDSALELYFLWVQDALHVMCPVLHTINPSVYIQYTGGLRALRKTGAASKPCVPLLDPIDQR